MGFITTDLLPALQLTHVLQAKKDGNDTYTTMGWTLANDGGRDLLFKDGGTPGYRTFLGFDKERKIGVVVLSNTDNSVTDIGWHTWLRITQCMVSGRRSHDHSTI